MSRWEHRCLGEEQFPETLSAIEIEHFFTLASMNLLRFGNGGSRKNDQRNVWRACNFRYIRELRLPPAAQAPSMNSSNMRSSKSRNSRTDQFLIVSVRAFTRRTRRPRTPTPPRRHHKHLASKGTGMARQGPCCGRRRLRHRIILLFGAVWLAALASSGSARANVVVDVNNALINIIQNTSAALVDSVPEVAREIALIDGAMFDAVNAASGSPYPPIAYGGGPVYNADPNAAALQAALTVMNSLYGPSSLYQQYEGVTGAAFYPSIPGYAGALVGPTVAQLKDVAAQINMINAELAALGTSSSVTAGISLGTAAGNAMLAVAANDGGYAASLQTLTPYVPPNKGAAGVYVPPGNRPAMTPTWGTVLPIGISSATLVALEATIPVAYAATSQGLTSQAYALQVLQTECQGSGTGLPSNVANACSAAGFAPESAAEAQAALFWNDPGGTFQPPGHWLQIADTIAVQEELDLLQTARATATVGLAVGTAGIGAWAIKYQDVAWRPVTAIQFSPTGWN